MVVVLYCTMLKNRHIWTNRHIDGPTYIYIHSWTENRHRDRQTDKHINAQPYSSIGTMSKKRLDTDRKDV